MSAPPDEGYGQFPGQQGEQPYDEQPADGAQPDAAAGGKKKRRGYAAGAFEVGSGANAAVGGQMQGGAPPQYAGQPQYGAPAGQASPGYGGYPADAQVPAAQGAQGYQYSQSYGAPQPGAAPQQPQQPAYGGYQAPDQGYTAPGAQPAPGQPAVAGITQGMGGMQLGGQQQQQQPQQPVAQAQLQRPAVLNQLFPSDLLSQPFNVAELDLDPPPIMLPPNVR